MVRRTAVAAAEPPRRPRRKPTTQSVQAGVEGVSAGERATDVHTGEVVEDTRKVEFKGEYFLMAEKIGLMPLLKFAHASAQGLDSTDMAGLDALYEMLNDCLDTTRQMEEKQNPQTGEMEMTAVGPSEWDRFMRHAIDSKADAEELMGLVQAVIERLAARPSLPPGDSSAGRRKTSVNSKASSSSQVMEGMVSVADLDH